MIPEYLSLMTVYGYEKMVYYKLTLNDALKEMKKISNEVNEIMNLPSPTMVRLLLNNFHWDANVLTERFYEDSSALFRKLNIVNPFPQTPVNANSQSPLSPSDNPLLHDISQNSDVVLCKTCCDYYPVHETYSLPCRHIFCLNCWGSYLKKKILQDNCGKTLTCPSRCNYLIEDDKVLELIDTDEIRQKFKRLMVETFVENNRKTKFCPGRGCDKIIKVKSSNCGSQLISCADCKTNFCFACTEIWHDPIQCSLLKKWQKKCFDESETCHWLEANTKDCPKCHTAIEKNGE
ncbi:unnamed protein product [Didymodactylos carnosus]|uniref:RBR-type E3 ubiquitin transferase n=1 Tax=Didymodactylos carnosus TaxID=1234261 RepID=A0A814CK22_9BILA|nr:unnamed protein product [Didymodactylos carnosus]CAF0941285.1 unnamed protein product [Didymodactylos carnosus]CAF3524282.1 unnamed protein product [Didymodactylos carnosus]CAF3717752.1 unnamed protein product [Didymodactylos carnosus]